MKKILMATVAASVMALAPVMSEAKDLALVIQNAAYLHIDRIRNLGPRLDTYADAYRRQGFEVLEITNANSANMRKILGEFERRAPEAERVIIDFTGRLDGSGGTLFALPTDHRTASTVTKHFTAPSIQLLFDLVRQHPGRSVVFVSSPNSDSARLIETRTDIPQGVLVVTGPYAVLRRAVVDQIMTGTAPNTLTSSGIEALGFVTGRPIVRPLEASAPAQPTPQSSSGVMVEMAAWRAAAAANTEASLRDYLATYPNGLFSREAEARLEALVPPAQRAEQALNLSRADRRAIQEQLTLLGFNTRGIDGIWGAGTRRAIRDWQVEQRFERTGFVDRRQVRVLARQAEERRAEVAEREAAERRATEQADLAFWQETGSGTNEAGIRAYLRRFPEGLFASQAKRVLAELEASQPKEDPNLLAQEQALGLTNQMRLLTEQRLQAQGINPGRVDGNFDGNTRAALREFQRGAKLRVTGYMNRETVAALIVSSFR